MLSISYCICCKTVAIKNSLIEIPVKNIKEELQKSLHCINMTLIS